LLPARIETHEPGIAVKREGANGTVGRQEPQRGRNFERKPVDARMDPTELPAAISASALEGRCAQCAEALDMFVAAYGSEAGNCALNFLATGGVFIGGNIAAKNASRMQDPIFMKSFLDKGRMSALLADIPVKIVVNDDAGIIGAARYTLIQKAFKSGARLSA
jgi:glucokinase